MLRVRRSLFPWWFSVDLSGMKMALRAGLCPVVVLLLGLKLRLFAAPGDENWDGTFGVPGADGPVYTIVITGNEVIFGGRFSQIGGIGATNVAQWNGTNRAQVGGGITEGTFPNVLALASVKGELYAAGLFTDAGGIPVSNIARWDGKNWFPLGSGVNNIVRALATDGTNLYVGGSFTMAGGIGATNIAKWDGTNWSALGDGIVGTAVDSLTPSGSTVYAGGRFTSAGGIGATNIAKWDGTNWSALGKGIRVVDGVGGGDNAIVRALLVVGDALYAGGGFRLAGDVGATNIARWDGTNWLPLGIGIDVSGEVYALVESGDQVSVGGFFGSAGGAPADDIASWSGEAWSSFGSGIGERNVSATVMALASNGTDIFVGGGGITVAGGKGSTNIALWHIPFSLRVNQTGNQLSLSWPATGTNFVLEAKDNITGTNWSGVSSPSVIHSNECVATDAITGPQRFYRLRKK